MLNSQGIITIALPLLGVELTWGDDGQATLESGSERFGTYTE
jgi:hypothetical protein